MHANASSRKGIMSAICSLLTFSSIVLLVIGIATNDQLFLFWSLAVIWLNNVLYGISDIYEHFPFLGFNLTFFLFLMGRFISNYGKVNFGLQFDNTIVNTILIELCISLIIFFLSYSLRTSFIINRGHRNVDNNEKKVLVSQKQINFRKACEILFYISTAFYFLETLERIYVYLQYGYFASYTVNVTTGSPIISRIATMSSYFFYGYCATLPSKKESRLPFIVYILGGSFTLLTGRRNEALLKFLFILAYYFMRDKEEEKWITKETWHLLYALLPAVLWFIVWYGFARIDQTIHFDTLGDFFKTLLNEQGVSITVFGYQQRFQDNPLMQQNFTFGQLIIFLKHNFISQLLLGTHTLQQNTIEAAEIGHSFGQTISYLALRTEYLIGRGLGSSYIVEVMQDYGYVGVVLINIVYGRFLRKFKRIDNMGFWGRLLVCYAIEGILYSPRDTALGPFFSIITFSSIAALALAYFLSIVIDNISRH